MAGPDTVTTFQMPENTRLLIVNNTFCISLFKCKGIIAEKFNKSAEKRRKHRIARERALTKVPFQAGSQMPNSRGRSGSFGQCPGDPALVRVSGFPFGHYLAHFRCLLLFIDL